MRYYDIKIKIIPITFIQLFRRTCDHDKLRIKINQIGYGSNGNDTTLKRDHTNIMS